MNTNMKTSLCLLLLCTAAAFADDAADVTKVDQQWADAVIHSDGATLGKIMADDLRYVHGNGSLQTKQQFLADVKSGGMVYHSLDAGDRKVRVIGSAAVVTESPRIKILMAGQEQDFTARFLRVYEKRNGS